MRLLNSIQPGKLLDREIAASIHLHRAGLLFDFNRVGEALDAAETACELRKDLIGNEIQRYSSHRTAEMLARILGNVEKAESHGAAAAAVLGLITDPEHALTCEVEHLLAAKQSIPDDLAQRVNESPFDRLKFMVGVVRSRDETLTRESRLESLDLAFRLSKDNAFSKQDKALVEAALGDYHLSNGNLDEAVRAYENCLELNPFSHHALQNCGATLLNSKLWPKAEVFFSRQIARLGPLPGLEFAHGRALFEQGKYVDAFKAFSVARKSDKVPSVDEYLKTCMERCDTLPTTEPPVTTVRRRISLDEFRHAVHDFAVSISDDTRRAFWKRDRETKRHVWKPAPESVGRYLFLTFLNARFGKGAAEVLQEVPAGAGILDLYILLGDSLRVVVELKVCGLNYSSGYALGGEDQLFHYIKSRDSRIGMLVVFDGRIRDFGKDFKSVQLFEDIVVYTEAVDVRPEVAKRSPGPTGGTDK